MKCVQNTKTNEIIRVSDKIAQNHVKLKTHKYVNRELWKKEIRDKRGE